MAVQIVVDLNTANAEQKAEAFRQQLSGRFGDIGDAVGRLNSALGKAAPKSLELLENSVDLLETGAKLGGVWGAGLAVLVSGYTNAVKRQEELSAEVAKGFAEIDKYAERFTESMRKRQREVDRLIKEAVNTRDVSKLNEEIAKTEEEAAETRDRMADATAELAKAEKELAEARGLFTRGTEKHLEAQMRLDLAQEKSSEVGAKLAGVLALQAAEAELFKKVALPIAFQNLADKTKAATTAGREWLGFMKDGFAGLFGVSTKVDLGEQADKAEKRFKEEAERGLRILQWREDRRKAIIQKSLDDIAAIERRRDLGRTAVGEGEDLKSALDRLKELGVSEQFGPQAVAAWTAGPAALAKVLSSAEMVAGHKQTLEAIEAETAALRAQQEVAEKAGFQLLDLSLQIGDAFQQAFQGAAADAFGAFIEGLGDAEKGLSGFGKTTQRIVSETLKALGKQFFVKSLGETAEALASLAFGDLRGAAMHGASAVAFGTAALATGVAGAAVGRGLNSSSTGSGGGGFASSSAGGPSGLGRSTSSGTQNLAPIIVNYNVNSLTPPTGREAIEGAQRLREFLDRGARGGSSLD